jgi:hypothetical protein
MVVTEQTQGSDSSASQEGGGPLTGIRQEARRATAGLRTAFQEELGTRLSKVGEQISSGASDLRGLSEKLQEQGRESIAHLATEAADKVEGVGQYFSDVDGGQIWAKAQEIARRQPWLVAGGCFVVGFLAARLVKASVEDEEDS